MNKWKDKLLQAAYQEQFLLKANTPENLKRYFIREFIEPLQDDLLNINKDFYLIENKGEEIYVKLVNQELLITVSEQTVDFNKLTPEKDSWNEILNVTFENSVPKVKKQNSHYPLKKSDLEMVMDKLFI